MTKHLIFDFDGVLADTLKPGAKAYQKFYNDPRTVSQIIKEVFIKACEHSHILGENNSNSQEEIQKQIQLALDLGKGIIEEDFEMFQGLVDEINKLRFAKLAIVSSGNEDMIDVGIKKTNLKFDYAFGCQSGPSKAHKIQTICDNWGIDISEVFYFTDTQADIKELSDVIAPGNLIGCAWGWQGYEPLRELLDSHLVLEEFFEIHRVIDNDDAKGEEKFNKNLTKNNRKQELYEIERQRRIKEAEKKEALMAQFMDEQHGGERVVGKESFGLFVGDKRSLTDLNDENIKPNSKVKDESEFEEQDDSEGYEEVSTKIELQKKYVLLDSTGIRRPGQRTFGAESFATFRTIEEAYAADVICMVVDGSEPLAHQDQVVAGIVKEAKKGVVVIVNKADLVDAEHKVKFQAEFEHKFQFLKVKKFVWVSALTRFGLSDIWDSIDSALEERNMEITRDELRKLFNYLMKQKPPKKLRLEKRPVVYDLLYTNEKTPTFELLVKNRQTIHWSYLRFLENTLRTNFGFENTEIKVRAVNVSKKKVMG
jgi:phosphoglycolate phosphatase-like HAD superfamily hydrolase